MVVPEYVEELFVGDVFWVVFNVDDFCMPSGVGADVFVGGVFDSAAHVPDCGVHYSGELAECFFYSPEASCSECCVFEFHSRVFLGKSIKFLWKNVFMLSNFLGVCLLLEVRGGCLLSYRVLPILQQVQNLLECSCILVIGRQRLLLCLSLQVRHSHLH